MYNVKELKKSYETNDYYYFLADYGNGYICDIIAEFADGQVDIYTSDLFEWAKTNFDYVEQAVNEGFVDTSHFDILQALKSGQYIQIEEELYENLDDCIKYYIYDYLDKSGVEELTDEQAEKIDELNFDNNDRVDDIDEAVNEIIKGGNENE